MKALNSFVATPWGPSQGEEKWADGITFYWTASHGGVRLSPGRQAQLNYKNNFLKNAEWWEEDCDWAIPYVFFSDAIKSDGLIETDEHERRLSAAWDTIKGWHPDFYDRMMKRLEVDA